MLSPFFESAGRSVSRQKTFRQILVVHAATLGAVLLVGSWLQTPRLATYVGWALLIAGIVEGALLVGWRLSQWPKSPAAELLLVTSISPFAVMLGEQLVGLTLLALTSLSSTPLLALFVGTGRLDPWQAGVGVLFGFSVGAMTGFGLVAWAYEPAVVRKWGERVSVAALLLYLVVGGLAGERTFAVLSMLPWGLGDVLRGSMLWSHQNNPFALIWRMGFTSDAELWRPVAWMNGLALMTTGAFIARAAWRMKSHYVDLHYNPKRNGPERGRGEIGDRPLTWWAVRRVQKYSGRINLYLAGGASCLYAAFLVAGPHWPNWLGVHLFVVFERMGGVAGLTTGLVLLSAVPAAYQFGLWDHSVPERCRRLELLLLTDLSPEDYRHASWRASWSRGRGYFLCAVILWSAGWLSGRFDAASLWLALIAGGALVSFYFAVGYRFLAQSAGGTAVGFFLSLPFPLLVWGLATAGGAALAALLPPGAVFYATSQGAPVARISLAIVLVAAVSLAVHRRAERIFDAELRRWYDRHQGAR